MSRPKRLGDKTSRGQNGLVPKRRNGQERTETDRNEPKRTYENTETDFYGYRNGPERISVGTETDRNRLQLIPKRTSMRTRKGRMGYDRDDPNKVMYVLVGRYIGRYVCR